jgi:hypothetical protein
MCVGILMCFKFFKSLSKNYFIKSHLIVNKFFKISKKKKEEEEFAKIHEKLLLLNSRMEYVEKNIQFNPNQMHL